MGSAGAGDPAAANPTTRADPRTHTPLPPPPPSVNSAIALKNDGPELQAGSPALSIKRPEKNNSVHLSFH